MRVIATRFIFTVAILFASQVMAQGLPYRYVEGTHYVALPKAVPVQDPDKIEVAEVFWYACSHCFHLESTVRAFEKDLPKDVNFVRVPAIWQPVMEVHARIYYTAQALGVLDTVHQGVFNAIHLDRKPLKDANEVADLFAGFGINKDDVLKTFNSAKVTEQLKSDYDKVRDYKITGTPQIIVDGRYRVEASRDVSQEEMFDVVNFLVAKIRAEKDTEKDTKDN